MEENKFERQVKEKMDELKIHPSDTVWEKIKVRIEKKKRPNRGPILLVFLFFALLTGGYMLWDTRQQPVKEIGNSEKANFKKPNNEIAGKKNIEEKENKITEPDNNTITQSLEKEKNRVENATVNNNTQTSESPDKSLPKGNQSAVSILKIKVQSRGNVAIVNTKPVTVNEVVSEFTEAGMNKGEPADILHNDEKIAAVAINPGADKDTTSGQSPLVQMSSYVKDTLRQTSLSTKPVKHSEKNKWRPGILFTGGISGIGNDFLGFTNTAPLDYLYSGGQYNFPGNQPGIPTSGAIPSKTKTAFGFIAGVFAERNISKKIIFTAGVNFRAFSTSTEIGKRNDSTGYYYTRNTSSIYNRYTSYYDFVELPATLKVQLGKGQKMPLFWQGGLVFSGLISSNVLQFNQNTGVYYKDNSILNKIQVGLNTSISASLFSKQKNSILAGPYFYYSASRLTNEGLYNKKHFVFAGLQAEIIFGK
ncbi:MAG: outer membrane beta-barrel protein [Ginsengibacter sp.]